jgi:hypothetical protein
MVAIVFFPPGGVTLEPLPALEGGAPLGLETVLALGVLEAFGTFPPGLVTLLALPGRLLVGVLEVGAVTLEAVIVVLFCVGGFSSALMLVVLG